MHADSLIASASTWMACWRWGVAGTHLPVVGIDAGASKRDAVVVWTTRRAGVLSVLERVILSVSFCPGHQALEKY